MVKKLDLSIVIVNYNTKDLLLECLQSIKQAKKDSYSWETIVVDNASTDGSVEAVKKRYKDIKILRSKKNLGFAAGNNKAITKTSGRYTLFLNPDTMVFPDTLTTMISFMDKNPGVGAATCRIELADGRLDEAAHRGFPTPWNAFTHFSGLEKLFPRSRLFSGYTLGWMSRERTHEIDAASGAFLLVRGEAGRKVSWWDEDYFWYGEDLDFCYRLKEAGWKVMYVPKVRILHYKGVASGVKKHSHAISKATPQTRKMAAKASTEAMRIFYRKHYLKKYPFALTALVLAGIWLVEKIRLLFW